MTRAPWAPVMLAGAVCALLAFPWPTPFPEVMVSEFAADRITIDPRGSFSRQGQIQLSPGEIALTALPGSQPTVHVLTAEVPFTAAFDVEVRSARGEVFPFQAKVWNPRLDAALEVWYAPDRAIRFGARVHDDWRLTGELGRYAVGRPRSWRVSRDDRGLAIETGEEGRKAEGRISRDILPQMFVDRALSLTVYASASVAGSSTVVVTNPVLAVPRQTVYGSVVRDRWYGRAVLLLALLALGWISAQGRLPRSWRHLWQSGRRRILSPRSLGEVGVIVLLVVSAFAVGGTLHRVSGYPYDMRSLVVWSRIAAEDGPDAVLGRSFLATDGQAHGGQPYAAVTYAYPPLLLYLPWAAAKLARFGHVEAVLKGLLTTGLAVGGVVIFVLLRALRVGRPAAALASAAYLLNPAMLFDGAVWGQTDAFLALFLLLAAAGVTLRSAPLVWIGLVLSVLTKQTGVLFAPVFLGLGLVRLGPRPLLRGFPPALIVSFLVLAPLLLAGVGPNAIVRPTVTKVLDFGTVRAMDAANAVVSQSAFTLWAVVSGLEGAHGWARLAFPDYVPSHLGPAYFLLSHVTFAVFTLALAVLFLRNRRDPTPRTTFLVLAAYGVALVGLLTRVQSRYLYFGVMFTAVSLPWIPRWLGGTVLVILSGAMLVSMWGVFVQTSIWYPGLLLEFRPERSSLNGAMAVALGSDGGITIGGVLIVGVLIVLLVALWKDGRGRTGPRSPRCLTTAPGD